MGDDEHFDAIISLLSISLDENKPNVELCQEAECEKLAVKILSQSIFENARYIPILETIARLAN